MLLETILLCCNPNGYVSEEDTTVDEWFMPKIDLSTTNEDTIEKYGDGIIINGTILNEDKWYYIEEDYSDEQVHVRGLFLMVNPRDGKLFYSLLVKEQDGGTIEYPFESDENGYDFPFWQKEGLTDAHKKYIKQLYDKYVYDCVF